MDVQDSASTLILEIETPYLEYVGRPLVISWPGTVVVQSE
jgi:hypothetical protein